MDDPSATTSSLKDLQPTSDSPEVQALLKTMGYKNAVAGFWYKFTLTIIDIVLGFTLTGMLMRYINPYPESSGYAAATGSFFGIVYTIGDIATWGTIERFIPEYRIKDRREMLKYVQFIIYYQSFSGLIQLTVLSWYAIQIAPNTELGFAVWIMLLNVVRQYPGYLGLFKSLLGAYQQYTQLAAIDFFHGNVVERSTQIGFMLLGRYYGALNPEIGEVMGLALGIVIGSYLDDVLVLGVEIYYFGRILKQDGYQMRDCWGNWIDKKVVINCLTWGWKQAFPSVIGSFLGFYGFYLTITYLPAYAVWNTLAGIASGLTWYIGTGPGNPTPLYTEAYQNDKKALTSYYWTSHFRMVNQCALFFVGMVFPVTFIFPECFVAMGIEFYLPAIPFIKASFIGLILSAIYWQGEALLYGAGKANLIMRLRFIWMAYDVFWQTLWLMWLQLPRNYGADGVLFYMVYAGWFVSIPKVITFYYLANKHVIHLHVQYWQTFGASGLAMGIIMLYGYLVVQWGFNVWKLTIGILIAAVIVVLVVVLGAFFLYWGCLGLFGGFDKESLEDFENAMQRSGSSKWIVSPLYYITAALCRRSPLHNRFRLEPTTAQQELTELAILRIQQTQQSLATKDG